MTGNSAEVQAYLDKNARWNFMANFLDLAFYSLALSFIFSSTVLSLYVSYLTKIALLIGLVPAIQNVGFFFPQLFLARITERLSRKKPLIMIISVMERLPYAVVGITLLAWPQAPVRAAYLILAVSLGTATLAGGLASPAWRAMVAKVVPIRRRGSSSAAAQRSEACWVWRERHSRARYWRSIRIPLPLASVLCSAFYSRYALTSAWRSTGNRL